MLTAERMNEIEDMIDVWNEKEQAKEEYPDTEPPLNHNSRGCDPKLFLRAAREMGITPEELGEWFERDAHETEVFLIESADLPEEQLRDAFSLADEARKEEEEL